MNTSKTLPTQEQVQTEEKNIRNTVDEKKKVEFICENYKILFKKSTLTRLENILITDCEQKSWRYKAPEQIELCLQTICFYMALEELGVDPTEW